MTRALNQPATRGDGKATRRTTSADLRALDSGFSSPHAWGMNDPRHPRHTDASQVEGPECEPAEFPEFCGDFDDYDCGDEQELIWQELADYNDSMARCHEDGWFYAGDDDIEY
jgi:hypothetical protein